MKLTDIITNKFMDFYTVVALTMTLASPSYAQLPAMPSFTPKDTCRITEENLVSQYLRVTDIHKQEGYLMRRFLDRDTKERCGMKYSIEWIDYDSKQIKVDFSKGVKVP